MSRTEFCFKGYCFKSFSPTSCVRVYCTELLEKLDLGNCLKIKIEGCDLLRLWPGPVTELDWAGANERRASILVWSVRSGSHCGKAGFQVSPIFLNIFSEIRGEMCIKVILNWSCKGFEWGWLEKLVDFEGFGGFLEGFSGQPESVSHLFYEIMAFMKGEMM